MDVYQPIDFLITNAFFELLLILTSVMLSFTFLLLVVFLNQANGQSEQLNIFKNIGALGLGYETNAKTGLGIVQIFEPASPSGLGNATTPIRPTPVPAPTPAPTPVPAPTPAPAAINANNLKFTAYDNATSGIRIKYPQNWAVNQGESVNSSFQIAVRFYPSTDPESDFTVGIHQLPAEITTNSYAMNTVNTYKKQINDFQQTSLQTNRTLSGNPAYEISGTLTDDKQAKRQLFDVGTVLKQKAYILQFDAKQSEFRNYLPVITNMINSFQIFPSGPGSVQQKITTDNTGTEVPGQQKVQTQELPRAKSIDSVKLDPGSSPTFFKCKETSVVGASTIPGLDAESSARAAITDGNPNTEIFGKSVIDLKFDNPLRNNLGPEIVIYEAGGLKDSGESLEVASIKDDGTVSNFKEYSTSVAASTDDCGNEITSVDIDLTDLEVEENEAVSGIRIDNNGAPGCCVGADISDVKLLDNQPASDSQRIASPEETNTLSEENQAQATQAGDRGENEGDTSEPMFVDVVTGSQPIRGAEQVVYVTVTGADNSGGIPGASVDGVLVDGSDADDLLQKASSSSYIDVSSIDGQKFSEVTDNGGTATHSLRIDSDSETGPLAIVVSVKADGYEPTTKIGESSIK